MPSRAAQEFTSQTGAAGAPPAGGPVDIPLGDGPLPQTLPSGASLTEQADGSSSFDFEPEVEPKGPIQDPADPDANLAEFMDDSDLDAIGAELIEAIDDDFETAAEWRATAADGIQLLGTVYEDRTYPFKGASGAYDPMLAEAVYQAWAKARGELLPAAGPVKTEIIGEETDIATDQAKRVKDFMNLYYTTLAPEWYPDMSQMLWWWALLGSMFKKVYQDPFKNRPVAPFLMPEKFVVNYHTTSLENCVRATHVSTLSQREARLRQIAGIWRDIDLGSPDADLPATGDNAIRAASDAAEGLRNLGLGGLGSGKFLGDSFWEFPESHCDLDLSAISNTPDPQVPKGLPVPYRVTLSQATKKVLAIHRNFKVGDPTFPKREWFIHYKLLPGPGFYGFGFAHILNNAVRTGTALRRQVIDGTTLSMFPGGVRVKGMKIENNNLMIGPCEFPEIDTGGLPIGQAFQTLPYKDVSPVSVELLKINSEDSQMLANTMDIAVGDGRQDAPVGTTVALMEEATRMESAMIKNAHVSLRQEFAATGALFGKHLPDKPYPFAVKGGNSFIMRADFQPNVSIIPVSDPNVTSSAQRMMRAQAISVAAAKNPGAFNQTEVSKRELEAMGIDDSVIAKLMPSPAQGIPSDPLTENQMALKGLPLAAAPWQAHAAHIAVHQSLAQIPAMQAHIAEHIGMQMRAQVEAAIGHPLPQGPLPPDLQNRVAMVVAQAMDALKKQQGNSITQDQIIGAELAQETQKITDAAQKVQTDAAVRAFEAQLKFVSDERDRAAKLRIAEIDAASGAFDNQTPPPAEVAQILALGNRQPIGGGVVPTGAPAGQPNGANGARPIIRPNIPGIVPPGTTRQ